MRRLTPFTATKPANSLVRSSVSRMISELIDATPPGCCIVRMFGATVQPCFPVPPGARRETLPATDVTGSAGGHVDALDGARRRLVVLELVVDLAPIAL